MGRGEITGLTGIRAVAALWVLLFHIRPELKSVLADSWPVIRFLLSSGYLGVDLFFILSGFIITYNYNEIFANFSVRKYLHFLWARLSRVYPMHVVTLFVMTVYVFILPHLLGFGLESPDRFTFDLWIENIFLVHAWQIPIDKGWNVPSWSISAEWIAYLSFPLLVMATRSVWHRYLALIIVLAFAAIPAVAAGSVEYVGTMSYGLVRIATEFSIGVLLHSQYRSGRWRHLRWDLIVPFAMLVAVVGGGISRNMGVEAFRWASVPLALVVYGLAWHQGPVARFLSHSWVMYWGYVSYSLYMVHGVVITIFRTFVPSASLYSLGLLERASLVLLLLGLMFGFAVLSYHFVEEPCRRAMRRVRPSWFETSAPSDARATAGPFGAMVRRWRGLKKSRAG